MISLQQVRVEYSGELLFGDVSFFIREGEKIGLVGNNGSGKTTLLKVLTGQVQPVSGTVNLPGSLRIGYLPQHMVHQEDETVYNVVFYALEQIAGLHEQISRINASLAERTDYDSQDYARLLDQLSAATEKYQLLEGDKVEAAIERTLTGLGFDPEDLTARMNTFSGGWKMRVELAKILLQEPDLLLLDEPTNHLDIESIQWFERYLTHFQGAVVLISHDRAFLDAVTTRTLELSLGRLFDFRLPYSQYRKERERLREQQKAEYENQQKKIRETQEFIDRFRYKANKASLVQSRIKQLEKMEQVQVDQEDQQTMHIRFPEPPRSGREVIKAGGITKYYGQQLVLEGVDFLIERGERVAFVGRNGEGKTTMARVLLGETDYSGEVTLGHQVEIGYYAQNQDEFLDDELTVFQTLDQAAQGEVRKQVRNILGAFLFQGEAVNKKVGVLSGGERSRLALARLLLHPYNMLILDEPTNHLDMRSKEVLKQALLDYQGTLLVVSHDRDFMDGLVSKVYEFRDHNLKEHIGGIYDFLRKKQLDQLDELNRGAGKTSSAKTKKQDSGSKADFEQRKAHNRRIRRTEKSIEKTEQRIEELEQKLEALNSKMTDPQNEEERGDGAIYSEYEQLRQEHEQEMEQWEQLHSELEQLYQQSQ